MIRIKTKSLSHTSNPTKLLKIHKKNFKVDLEQSFDNRTFFDIKKLNIKTLNLPNDASVYIYVTSGNSEIGFSLGSIGKIREPKDRYLDTFSANSTLWFRLLVVDDQTSRILASAEKIQAKAFHAEEREPLLPVEIKDNMKNRIWKVHLVPNHPPVLYLNKEYPKVLHQITRSKVFRGLILQEAMRQSLEHFIKSDRGDNNPDTWQYKWDLFLKDLKINSSEIPDEDAESLEVIRFIDKVIEVFSGNIKLFDNAVEEANQLLEKFGGA
jgi:hypothetical protein